MATFCRVGLKAAVAFLTLLGLLGLPLTSVIAADNSLIIPVISGEPALDDFERCPAVVFFQLGPAIRVV